MSIGVQKPIPKNIKIIRWIARIWSLLIFAFAMVMVFFPDSSITEPIPFEDWFLLSLWGIAIIGLLAAWRWEWVGGIIAIAVMFFREVMWIILKGGWMINFLIFWFLIIPPAVLFMIASRRSKRSLTSY